MSGASAGRLDTSGIDVLAVDDDACHARLVGRILRQEGYAYRVASTGEEALRLVAEQVPDLVVLDVGLPGMSGTDVLAALRADWRTAQVPVVFVTGHAGERVAHLLAGADDYVTKPFDPDELAARIGLAIRRVRTLRDTSPLTRLPGNMSLHHETAARLAAGSPFAALWADIDHFKVFNDRYGYLRGDALILALAESVRATLTEAGVADAFPAHLGGDDFVVLTGPDHADQVAEAICRRFEEAAADLCDAGDRVAGHLKMTDRTGRLVRHPLPTLSIGVVVAGGPGAAGPAELAGRAADVKAMAKRRPGSAWAFDRRGTGTDFGFVDLVPRAGTGARPTTVEGGAQLTAERLEAC